MARPTTENLYTEIKLVKQEVCYVKDNQARMQKDLAMIKKTILNPDYGTVSRVNKNTAFRKSTGRVLWSLWIAVIGLVGKILFWD